VQQLALGGTAIAAHSGGDSKEFGGPLYKGKFTYNPCSFPAAVCESAAYLSNVANVANYQQSFGNAHYTVDDALWSVFAQDDFRVTNRVTLSGGIRYERQNFTDATHNLGPRAGVTYAVRADRATVLRVGFSVYHSQILDNTAANYALGEPSGVFSYTAAPGQAGFPASITAAPLAALPAGAGVPVRSLYVRPGQPAYLNQWFPTSALNGYPRALLNPYSQQYTASLEQRLGSGWAMTLDYVGTHTLRIVRPLDVDGPAPFIRTVQGQSRSAGQANCTRPYWGWWYHQRGTPCISNPSATYPQPSYAVIQTDVNDGYLHYNALDLNITHAFDHGFSVLASYVWSKTLDNVDPDATSQNPNDTNSTQHEEYGPAIYDQRHRAVLSGIWDAPLHIIVGGVGTLGTPLPFNYVTGTVNSGDTGGTTDRPVINGAVVGRNSGRGWPIYSLDMSVSRVFPFRDRGSQVELRVEAFNALNHRNFVAYSGNYGNGGTAPATLGLPTSGVTAQLPARFLQFIAKFSF